MLMTDREMLAVPGELTLLTQTLNRCQLRHRSRQFGLCCCVIDLGIAICQCFFREFLRSACLGFVQIRTADCGIGQNGHGVRLHFQQTAGDENEFVLRLARNLDAYRTWLDARDQGSVARINPQLTRFTRQRDEFRLAGEDFFFGGDYVNVNSMCHVVSYPFSRPARISGKDDITRIKRS